MTKRLENWPSLLDTFLTENKDVEFKWGTRDCCLFAADAVMSITGVDMGEPYRGKYKTIKGAHKYMPDGVAALATKIMQENGCESIAPNFAQRGDLVVFEVESSWSGEGHALGIIDLNGEVTGQGEFGLLQAPRDKVVKAWRI